MTDNEPVMLMILDGWGSNPNREGNAFAIASTPNLDQLLINDPTTTLRCAGEAVGLPDGVMGNSEVGHMNIGAGRIVFQELLRINQAIGNGDIFSNAVLTDLMTKVIAKGSALHLFGLVSDGGVHSHLDHLLAILEMAKRQGVENVFVHAILDGRDTPPHSGAGYLAALENRIEQMKYGAVATICGRYYAMDRDTRWDRIEKAYRLFTKGTGVSEHSSAAAVRNAYERGETDEFVLPIVLTTSDNQPLATVKDGDGILFFNFRSDRVREMTVAFTQPTFDHFQRGNAPDLCGFVCMTRYDEKFDLPVAFQPLHLDDILGEVVSRAGLPQLRIAETEKYAHVTYFFNGGEEKPFALEDRCLIPSPRDVPTYDRKPEMSARLVTDEVVSRIESGRYHLIVLNLANMDMVGHTGVLDAAVAACEVVDECVGKIVDTMLAHNGSLLITADHGNAETMVDDNGEPHTAHTLNPVRLILVGRQWSGAQLREGVLGDIAPTILEMMGIAQPEKMTGKSLLSGKNSGIEG
jgi:2,3-bisphosphoglycerate-independent phosphoglycerate mutase